MVVKLDPHIIEKEYAYARDCHRHELFMFVYLTWKSKSGHIMVQVSYEYLYDEAKDEMEFYKEFVEIGVTDYKGGFNTVALPGITDMEKFKALMSLLTS